LVDVNGNTALHWAAWWGFLQITEMMLAKGNVNKFINIKNQEGQSALDKAIIKNNRKLALYLRQNGALCYKKIYPY
jgi:ankyrin repeat protein